MISVLDNVCVHNNRMQEVQPAYLGSSDLVPQIIGVICISACIIINRSKEKWDIL